MKATEIEKAAKQFIDSDRVLAEVKQDSAMKIDEAQRDRDEALRVLRGLVKNAMPR